LIFLRISITPGAEKVLVFYIRETKSQEVNERELKQMSIQQVEQDYPAMVGHRPRATVHDAISLMLPPAIDVLITL
jgi:hypothetical protein